MNRRVKILLSSYIDGECINPEEVKKMIMEDKRIQKIYYEMLRSKEIRKLNYRKNTLSFECLFSERRFTFYPILISAGAIFIAFLFLFPGIRHIKPRYNLNNINIYITEVMK